MTVSAERPEESGWPGYLKTNGTSRLTEPTFTVSFEGPGAAVCTWSFAKVDGTFNTDGRPISIATSAQKFKRLGTLAACPKKGTLSATWALTTVEPKSAMIPVALG